MNLPRPAARVQADAQADHAARTLQATRWLMWLLVVPVLVLLAVLTWLQYQRGLRDAEAALAALAQVRAQELQAVARPAMAHVLDLRRLLESQWHSASASADAPELRALLRPRSVAGKTDGWSLDEAPEAARERQGQLWWAPTDEAAPDAAWLRRAALFTSLARVVHQRAPGFEATWFAAANVNSSFGYPWVATDTMLRSMGASSLMAIDGPRRAAAERSVRALAQDPNDLSFWGSPYVSQLDGQLVISHGSVVVVDGRYQGEVSLDFRLDELQRQAERWQRQLELLGERSAAPGQGRVWIVDDRHRVLADSAAPLALPKGLGLADTPVRVALLDLLPPTLRRAGLDDLLTSPGHVRHGEGWRLFAAQHIGSPWIYVHAVADEQLRAAVLPTLHTHFWLALALLAMFVAGQWFLARRFVGPALSVLAYLRRLSRGDPAAPPALGGRWQAWVDEVTETFRRQHDALQRERRIEAFKSAIFDNTAAIIVTTDADGHIVEFNSAAEQCFGHAREVAIGQVFGELLIPERHRSVHLEQMARLRAGEAIVGLGRPLEMRALRADGSELPVEILTTRVEVDGQVFYIGCMTDLSARFEAKRQIEQQRDALRRSERMSAMGSLLAGVAHELNNPLAIVLGRAHLLEEKCEHEPTLVADARRIREAAERCGRIVRTFLNMARSRPTQRATVALNDLVRAAAEMLAYTYRSHDIELALDFDDALPAVDADGDQIGQVVLNLMVNAQQALAGREGRRRVRISTGVMVHSGGPRAWLRVADNGAGVGPAARGRIFEPFFTTKPEGIGTGLGLAVSRTIALEHGGDLVLEDATGEGGASLRLELPLGEVAVAAAVPAPALTTGERRAARILVVDDEAEISDLMRSMLEAAGYEVATAESGAVALAMLEAAEVDAIVSDLRMPDMDGAALWRAVRERYPSLSQRMLFVTGDTLSPDARGFLDEAHCTSLDKPFSRGDLLQRVKDLLPA